MDHKRKLFKAIESATQTPYRVFLGWDGTKGWEVVSMEEKKTICLRLHLETHRRLRHVKHELEKETFNEVVQALLDEHDRKKKQASG